MFVKYDFKKIIKLDKVVFVKQDLKKNLTKVVFIKYNLKKIDKVVFWKHDFRKKKLRIKSCFRNMTYIILVKKISILIITKENFSCLVKKSLSC